MSKRCTDIALEYFNGRRKLIGSIREEIMGKVVSQRMSTTGYAYMRNKDIYEYIKQRNNINVLVKVGLLA